MTEHARGPRRPHRALTVALAGLAASAALVGVSARPAASQDAGNQGGPALALVDQTFAVRAGERAHFEYVVNADVPQIVATTTTTTTTSTTTTTTTTVVVAPTFPPEHPYAGAEIPEELWADFGVVPGSDPVTATTGPAATEPVDTEPPGPEMTVRVTAHQAVRRRDEVTRALEGLLTRPSDAAVYDLADVSELVDGVRRLTLDVLIAGRDEPQPTDRALDLTRPGLYPITIEIQEDGVTVADDVTFIERLPDAAGQTPLGPFRLAVVAGVADPGPDISDQELIQARPQLIELAAVARTVGSGITAAIPPELARLLLSEESDLSATLNEALATSELVDLTNVPLDPSSAAASGLDEPLGDLRVRGTDILTRRFPGIEHADSVWLVDGPLTPEGGALLSDLGVSLLAVPYDHYATLGGNVAGYTDPSLLSAAELNTPDGAANTIDVAIVDPINELLDPARERDDTVVGEAVSVMASMSAIRQQLPPAVRGFVLATPDFGVPDADVLEQIVGFVAELQPDFSFVRLSELGLLTNHFFVNGAPHVVTLDPEPAVDLAARVSRVDELRLLAADAETMLPEFDSRLGIWATAFTRSTSTGLTESEANAVLDDVASQIDEVRTAIEPPEVYPFTLPSKRAELPLRIANTSGTPLNVVIRLTAEKLEMVGGELEVTLDPGHVNEIAVEVEARSNGVFPVVVEVFSPGGNPLTEPVELQARVNTLTGLGWVVTVGGVLVLLSWWYSHLRRQHRARRSEVMAASALRHPVRFAASLQLITSRQGDTATIEARTDNVTDTTLVPADAPDADLRDDVDVIDLSESAVDVTESVTESVADAALGTPAEPAGRGAREVIDVTDVDATDAEADADTGASHDADRPDEDREAHEHPARGRREPPGSVSGQ